MGGSRWQEQFTQPRAPVPVQLQGDLWEKYRQDCVTFTRTLAVHCWSLSFSRGYSGKTAACGQGCFPSSTPGKQWQLPYTDWVHCVCTKYSSHPELCSLPLGGLGTARMKSLFRQEHLLTQWSVIPHGLKPVWSATISCPANAQCSHRMSCQLEVVNIAVVQTNKISFIQNKFQSRGCLPAHILG